MGKPLTALELPELAAAPAVPPAGRAVIYTRGKKLYTRIQGGGAGAAGPETEIVLGDDTRLGGAAPANMLTTDTAQTLDAAGVKRFPPGTLLMRSATGVDNEPYSDSNPPFTLNMSELPAAPATPVNGQATLYSPDGKSLRVKADDGTDNLIGPPGIGGPLGSSTYNLSTDYATSTPAAPASGVTLFARARARRIPAWIGPTGLDTAVQPALFANRVGILAAQNGVTNLTPLGLPSPTTYTTTAAAVTITPASGFYTSRARLRYPSAATANAFAGFRLAGASWFLSTVANNGGFFWVFRFGINAGTTTARCFVGLSATNANEANADPTTLTNRIGFGFNSASSNFYFHSAGATANAAVTDLGISFPARAYNVNFYEFRLFAPAGSAQVFWSAHRLNDDVVVTGGPVTTNLPAVNTLLTHHSWMNNVAAAAVALDFQSLYIETDN